MSSDVACLKIIMHYLAHFYSLNTNKYFKQYLQFINHSVNVNCTSIKFDVFYFFYLLLVPPIQDPLSIQGKGLLIEIVVKEWGRVD